MLRSSQHRLGKSTCTCSVATSQQACEVHLMIKSSNHWRGCGVLHRRYQLPRLTKNDVYRGQQVGKVTYDCQLGRCPVKHHISYVHNCGCIYACLDAHALYVV